MPGNFVNDPGPKAISPAIPGGVHPLLHLKAGNAFLLSVLLLFNSTAAGLTLLLSTAWVNILRRIIEKGKDRHKKNIDYDNDLLYRI
jgi:hypothetical protein